MRELKMIFPTVCIHLKMLPCTENAELILSYVGIFCACRGTQAINLISCTILPHKCVPHYHTMPPLVFRASKPHLIQGLTV